LDVSRKSLAVGEQRFPGQADFVKFDGHVLPFPDNYFSLVFAVCVFHHIDQTEHDGFLTELRRILDPAGAAVIFEHNPYNPLTRRAVNSCPFDENAVLITAKLLRQRMMKAGFGSVAYRYQVFFPSFLRRLRPIESYLNWLPLGAQYYVFANKMSSRT
jgi:ubiquinone/menaquinone biosynthesis C-methylase UbiE